MGAVGFYSGANVVDLFNTNTLTGFSLDAASGVAIDTTGGNLTLTTAQPLTASRSLIKLGSGTLTLQGNNTYSGATTISAGTLVVGNTASAGKLNTGSAITIATGANLTFNRATAMEQGTDFSTAAITGGGSFTKIGSGITTFNAANSYTGTTTINDGMLKYEGSATLAQTSGNLILSGGVIGLAEDLTRDLGSGDNQVQWVASGGGFAAIGADRTVSLNGGGNVQWNSGGFVPGGQALVLGHTGADKTVTFTNNINFAGSVRTIQVDDGAAAVDAVLTGIVGSTTTGGFTKTGAGTLKLTNNTSFYTGATSVTNGTLIVNGNISTSSLTTVQTGATLGGSGTVGALIVDFGGILAPGNSTGILDVDGAYTQNGTLSLELNGITPESLHDQVNVTGSVTPNGLLAATVGYTPAVNNLLFILVNDGNDAITGTFTGLAQGDTVTFDGFDWQISYTADSVGGTFLGGNDVALMAVPEPQAALHGGLGLLALLRRRRN